MDLENTQNNSLAKLPLLKQEEGNSFKPVARTTTNEDGTSTTTIPSAVTAEQKILKKTDLKARSILMMTLLGEIITPEELNLKFLRSLPTEWGQTTTGKESSNPFMAGSLPKTINSNNVDEESQKIGRQAQVMISDAEEYLISEDPVKQGRMEETENA
ncbi:hypothetical protein Tco_0432839 [Tanacetum coccineum]